MQSQHLKDAGDWPKHYIKHMRKLTKILFVLSVAGFLAGILIDSRGAVDPRWTVVLPLGAVCFGLFLIFYMLQKEMAAFDQEASGMHRPEADAARVDRGDRVK